MDKFDRAQATDARFLKESLKAHQKANKTEFLSRLTCLDCDEPIPQKRRDAVAGCLRCIDCQTEYELENR